jgi:hypothetical protein
MAPALFSGKVLAADEAATNVETAAGLDEIVATVTLRLEVVGQSLVILFTEHNDAYIIDTVASIFRRELKEARAPVSLQYDKKTLSDWTTTLASVFKSVTWIERHPSHFKKAMLKLPFGKACRIPAILCEDESLVCSRHILVSKPCRL